MYNRENQMISELKINNYKSLQQTEPLSIGRFNVLIGENGCGKSNLLEAIAMIAAAESNKLDKGDLESRGIRVPDSILMRSAFNNDDMKKAIKIYIKFKGVETEEIYTLNNDNQPYSKWNRAEDKLIKLAKSLPKLISELNGIPTKKTEEKIEPLTQKIDVDMVEQLGQIVINTYLKHDRQFDIKDTENYFKCYFTNNENVHVTKNPIEDFIIYSPENTALRNFNKEGQIQPLGINGEGLFKLLNVIQKKSPDEQWQEIHSCLQLFNWYSEFNIPKTEHLGLLAQSEDKITITDHYLTMDFDQRSANEGFLFVLFYIALMVSDDTPKIFAIDNIDTSLNPKLCTKIIKELIRLAKKYDKQVFVTTHNPAILDGIDLGDDEQRLFVVSRNKTGHTRFKRITLKDKPKSSTNEDLKLSEAFLRGYLGGLPKGF
jgi:predicted ATPase